MSQAFSKLFWGFLFVIIEIHIIAIDILADPIGYYFIFSGITLIVHDFPIGSKAKNLSFVLILLSIPTIFIQQNTGMDQLGQLPFVIGWPLYMSALGVIKLILVFYLFQLIFAIVHQHGDEDLKKRSERTFYIYMIVTFVSMIVSSFAINFSMEQFMAVAVFVILSGFIIEIAFLALLHSLRKLKIDS
ncbi:hypothetical protein [Calidifontibacillus oryziterrae]|uniref:hypothetical protein n=1 Tax=Calidifontibacillus oryziterrae TaxID=1191699 RepID=UPI00031A3D5E|nr:hypothetical protein [Calidifontibacillus oryziterrae]